MRRKLTTALTKTTKILWVFLAQFDVLPTKVPVAPISELWLVVCLSSCRVKCVYHLTCLAGLVAQVMAMPVTQGIMTLLQQQLTMQA